MLESEYLRQIVAVIGSGRDADEQQRAMKALNTYLFAASDTFDCTYVRRNMLADRERLIAPALKDVLAHLLDEATIDRLERQEWDGLYGATAYFQDLRAGLFGDWNPDHRFTFEQMDMQMAFLRAWKEAVGKNDPSLGMQRLRAEFEQAKKQLETLSRTHCQPAVRNVYKYILNTLK